MAANLIPCIACWASAKLWRRISADAFSPFTAATERKKVEKPARDNRQTRRLRNAGRSLLDIRSNIAPVRVSQDSGRGQILNRKDIETTAIGDSCPARHWRITVRFSQI